MKIAELRAKSKEELKEVILSAKKEQFNLRMQSATGALEKKDGFKAARKTIARAKTLLNEKQTQSKAAAPKKAPAKKAKKG